MKQLKEARKAAKLTQLQLADAIGASRSAVAMWEAGKSEPDNQMLVKLSQVLHVSIGSLLGETEEDTISNLTITDKDPQRMKLDEFANRLNANGLQKLVDYAEDLADAKKYQK